MAEKKRNEKKAELTKQKPRKKAATLKTRGSKMLMLSLENLAFLKTIQGQSLFVNDLLDRCRKQETLMGSRLTSELVEKYRELTGVLPEKAYQKFLQKRIALLEKNLTNLKERGFTNGNLSGTAFVKLDQTFEQLQKENEKKDLKYAVTHGMMFRKAGSNQQTIRNWFQARHKDIEAYHKSLGIENPQIHNRQVAVVERVRRAHAAMEASNTNEDVSSEDELS